MFRSLRAQLLLIPFAFAVVVAASGVANVWTLRAHDDDETQIKMVGGQQALTNRLLWLALSEPHSPVVTDLASTIEQNLQSLMQGGRVVDTAGGAVTLPPATGLVRSQLEAAAATGAMMREHVAKLAALPADDPAHREVVQALAGDSIALYQQISATVDTLETRSHERHDRLLLIQAVFVAVGLVVIVWGYVFTGYSVLRPLAALGTAARRIGAGQLSEPVAALRDDELGRLARSMEAMRGEVAAAQTSLESRVAERTRELAVAFEFSQDITQQLELGRLFESVTERARSLMQAEAASLCLVTPEGTGVRLVSRNGRSTTGDNLRQPIGNEPILQVVGENQAYLSDVAQSACGFLDADPCDQCLAAPLRIGDHNIGAICIVRGSRSPFEEEEKRALTLLANSTAIAIANAHLLESERQHAEQTAAAFERERLAAELHDNLAQTLSFLKLKTDRVERMVSHDRPDAAVEELEGVRSAIDSAYGQVRLALRGLTQPTRAARDFGQDLTAYVAEYREATGLAVDMTICEASLQALSPLSQKQALHILREALTNVLRHAQAQSVQIHFARDNGDVRMVVEDNGRGFDPGLVDGGDHLGLAIMQTRAERIGGRLTIDSALGRGTKVVARFPVQTSNGDNPES